MKLRFLPLAYPWRKLLILISSSSTAGKTVTPHKYFTKQKELNIPLSILHQISFDVVIKDISANKMKVDLCLLSRFNRNNSFYNSSIYKLHLLFSFYYSFKDCSKLPIYDMF